jgi:5-methylcytosine-specific restriction endonuclease McrA
MKNCYKCGLNKETFDFHKNKNKYDGFSSECKACDKLRCSKYRQNNENLKSKKEKYRVANKKVIAEKLHQYYLNNKEKIRQNVLKYKKDNPKKYQMYANKRLAAKKSSIVEDFSIDDVIFKYGSNCYYCLIGNFEHIDHYIPLSKGGCHTLSNVRPSCADCNLRKHDKMPEDFESKDKL